MAIDFPNSPTNGQQFSSGGSSWVWDGVAWNLASQMQTVIPSDAPPANPAVGQIWWRGTNGKTYIWTDDGNTKQWVEIGCAAQANTLWETITTIDFVAMTQRDVPNLGAFYNLRITWDAVAVSGDNAFNLRYSSDNGATFYAGANDYVLTQIYLIQLPSIVVGNAIGTQNAYTLASGVNALGGGYLNISRFNKATQKPTEGRYVATTVSAGNVQNNMGGYGNVAAAMNALRFIGTSTGLTGHVLIEGVRG